MVACAANDMGQVPSSKLTFRVESINAQCSATVLRPATAKHILEHTQYENNSEFQYDYLKAVSCAHALTFYARVAIIPCSVQTDNAHMLL